MSTMLHSSPIYGPIKSRRLGISLGINLMPQDGKICNFDCIYCECGLNAERKPLNKRPSKQVVIEALETQLRQMSACNQLPDMLTFAGNGEPTAHPEFAEIIVETIRLRNLYCADAKISLLSNATFMHKWSVRNAMMCIDNNIIKLDTVSVDYINWVNRPQSLHYDVNKIISQLQLFEGQIIIQTMFMQGHFQGKSVDNTTDEYVLPWLKAIEKIKPKGVMIYTIDRETPIQSLQKALPSRLDNIAKRVELLGIPCTVSY